MFIVKSLANTTSWMVYHSAIGNNSEIYLNATNAEQAHQQIGNDTAQLHQYFM